MVKDSHVFSHRQIFGHASTVGPTPQETYVLINHGFPGIAMDPKVMLGMMLDVYGFL